MKQSLAQFAWRIMWSWQNQWRWHWLLRLKPHCMLVCWWHRRKWRWLHCHRQHHRQIFQVHLPPISMLIIERHIMSSILKKSNLEMRVCGCVCHQKIENLETQLKGWILYSHLMLQIQIKALKWWRMLLNSNHLQWKKENKVQLVASCWIMLNITQFVSTDT